MDFVLLRLIVGSVKYCQVSLIIEQLPLVFAVQVHYFMQIDSVLYVFKLGMHIILHIKLVYTSLSKANRQRTLYFWGTFILKQALLISILQDKLLLTATLNTSDKQIQTFLLFYYNYNFAHSVSITHCSKILLLGIQIFRQVPT